MSSTDLNNYKDEHLSIARQLCYSDKYLKRIREAESEMEVDRIMHDARLDDNTMDISKLKRPYHKKENVSRWKQSPL